jgi:broad specificity phosphatase PhoE
VIIYLVRHGAHASVDKVLCGRSAGVPLSPEGVTQAHQLAAHFAGSTIDAVQSSPRQRTRETAGPIAAAVGRPIDFAEGIDELDAGEWTGRSFSDLAGDAAWQKWNTNRDQARPPGGESMRELQARVIRHLQSLEDTKIESVVLVSHAEPIRAALLHCLDVPLDRFGEIAVAPGSISIVRSEGGRLTAGDINLQVRP